MNVHTYMTTFYYQLYKNSVNNLQFIITSLVSKIILLKVYEISVHYEKILPIESLPESEKEKLRSECLGTGIKFNNRQMNNACRILYTLKNIS